MTGLYKPCMYHHPSRDILCLVYGGDFVSVGCPEMLRWLRAKLQGRFETKTIVVGSNEEGGEERETRILNRIVRVTNDDWEYDVDQRHADLIIQETGASGMSSMTHPGGDTNAFEEEGESEE